MEEILATLVTTEKFKDPKFRETLNIIDLFNFHDKAQPSDSEDTRKSKQENPA